MTKVLVLYYSSYGHIETLSASVAEGAAEVPGVEVTVKRVPEIMTAEATAAAGFKTEQGAPVASRQRGETPQARRHSASGVPVAAQSCSTGEIFQTTGSSSASAFSFATISGTPHSSAYHISPPRQRGKP